MDFRAILTELVRGDVRFVLVGGVAAALQGAAVHTYDVDVVPALDRENAHRLHDVLLRIEARYREHEPKRIEPRADDLTGRGHHLLMTSLGPLDVLGSLAGGHAYDDLIGRAPRTDVGQGLAVHVLDLEALIEVKEALGRDKDRAQLPEYRRTLAERRRRERPGDP